MSMSETDDVLNKISMLLASGLETKTEPFPETEKEFGEILKELRALDPYDLKSKLVLGGFLPHPSGAAPSRCLACLSYPVPRQWCALPVLAVPVEAEWWCRLWRI